MTMIVSGLLIMIALRQTIAVGLGLALVLVSGQTTAVAFVLALALVSGQTIAVWLALALVLASVSVQTIAVCLALAFASRSGQTIAVVLAVNRLILTAVMAIDQTKMVLTDRQACQNSSYHQDCRINAVPLLCHGLLSTR